MRRTKGQSLRFTRIELRNWKNFTSAAVDLRERAFLIGPNASGKSNFLDAFRFLHDVVRGGFRDAVSSRGGVSKLRSLAAREQPQIGVRASIGNEENIDLWEYEIRFTQDNLRRPVLKYERVAQKGNNLFTRPDADDRADLERLT